MWFVLFNFMYLNALILRGEIAKVTFKMFNKIMYHVAFVSFLFFFNYCFKKSLQFFHDGSLHCSELCSRSLIKFLTFGHFQHWQILWDILSLSSLLKPRNLNYLTPAAKMHSLQLLLSSFGRP